MSLTHPKASVCNQAAQTLLHPQTAVRRLAVEQCFFFFFLETPKNGAGETLALICNSVLHCVDHWAADTTVNEVSVKKIKSNGEKAKQCRNTEGAGRQVGSGGGKGALCKEVVWESCGKPDGVTSVSHAAQTNRSGSRRVKTVRTEEEF